MANGLSGKKVFFSVNPMAGGGKSRQWWEQMRPQLDQIGLDYFWEYTAAAATAGSQARAAVLRQGAEAVITVGGDGTIYEVLNGLVDEDKLIRDDLIMGEYSSGSACDFARTIYADAPLPLPELLLHGRVEHIDIGRAEYRSVHGETRLSYFINSFDAGAGADTCVAVNSGGGRIKRRLKNGKLAFMLTALDVLLRFDYTETQIETELGVEHGEYIIIGVGNGKYIGGGMMLFPQAEIADGLLNVLLVQRRPRLEILDVFRHVYDGSFLSYHGISTFTAREITIKTARPLDVELDGEVPGRTEANLRVLPQLLPFLLPDCKN